MKRRGFRDSTVEGYSRIMRNMAKSCNLDNPEEIKGFIAYKEVKDSRKEKLVNCYHNYLGWRGLTWQKPIYQRDTSLPFIPLEKEIDQLIGSSRGKISTFLELIKESAVRPIESWRVKWTEIDFERNIIYINSPAKHSNPRTFKPSNQLLNMIHRLQRKSDYLFREHNESKLKDFSRTFYLMRKNASERLQNPRLNQISFRTLRHWKATVEYHRTKDILYVMQLLGHKNIKNTLIYSHLVNFEVMNSR